MQEFHLKTAVNGYIIEFTGLSDIGIGICQQQIVVKSRQQLFKELKKLIPDVNQKVKEVSNSV